jgi:hypothetical protein
MSIEKKKKEEEKEKARLVFLESLEKYPPK